MTGREVLAGLRGTFEWPVAGRAAPLLALSIVAGCSNMTLPKEAMPATGADPSYTRIANYLKNRMKDIAAYDSFEISDPRWVHSTNGWNWLVCVRFQDRGHRRTYAFFFTDEQIVDSRYAVQTDACDAQTYSPFDLTTGARRSTAISDQGPLY